MNKLHLRNSSESGVNENDIYATAEKIKTTISRLIKKNELEVHSLIKKLDQIKIEIQKLNTKIDTLIALRDTNEIDKHLEEIISSFRFLVQTKKVSQESLTQKIAELEREKNQLIQENKNLIEQIDKDDLTKVFNRRKFNSILNKAFNTALSGRHKQLSLAIIDIDNFKNINDTYGHTTGDFALKTVAKLLKNILSVNAHTAVFRYGGEEFAVLSQGDFGEIQKKMLLFGEKLKQQNILKDTSKGKLHITASVGLSKFNEELHTTPEDLINDADKKMYFSKNNGKDQITL